MPRRFGALLLSGVLVTSVAGLAGMNPAGADAIGPIDFEAPTYAVGSIDGQDGWVSTGSAKPSQPLGYDHAVAAQSLYDSFGDQSLRISNAVTSGSFGDQTFSKPLSDGAGETGALANGLSGGVLQPRFTAEWSFAPTVATPQPGLSVVASPDRGDGSRMSWVQMTDTGDADGLDVNFFDVQGMSPEADCGPTSVPCANFVQSPVASGLSRTEPHTIKITIDFLDGPSNDVVNVYVDGILSHTGTTWEEYYNTDKEAKPEGGPRTVDSMLFRTSGTPVVATSGKGFFIDGLKLSSSAIPTATPPSAPGKNYDGNMKCAEMAPDGVTWEEFKIEGVPDDGDHKIPNTDLVITISNASSQTFDWDSSFDMSAVLVKGSNGGIHYQYPGTTDTSDTGLHALVHDETKENPYHDISHVSFCYQVGGDDGSVVPTELENPGPVAPQQVNPASDETKDMDKDKDKDKAKTTVLGETLVAGDTLPRTGAAATNMLALAGGLGLAFGLMMLMLGRRKTTIQSS